MRFCPMALVGILPLLLLLLSPYNAGVEGAKKGKKHAVENGGTKDVGIQVGGEEIEKELQKPEGQTSKSAGLGTFHPSPRPLSTSLSGRQSSLRGHIGGENAVVGDVNARTIFVPNLSYDVDSKELREYFARFGGVEKAFVGNSRPGWGRVTMKDANVVANILKYPNRVIHGRKSHFRQNIPVKMRKKSALRFRKPLDASSQEFVSSPLGKFKTIAAYHGIDVRDSPKSAAAAEQQKSQFHAASAGDIVENAERAENAESAENAEKAAEKAENADERPPMGADERAENAEKLVEKAIEKATENAETAEIAGENAEAESAYEGPPMAADDADTAGDNSNLSGFKAGSEAGAEIKHPSKVDLPPTLGVESARKKSWAEMVREEEEEEAIKGKEAIAEGEGKVPEEKGEEEGENPWETVVKKRRGSGSGSKREGKGKNANFVEAKPAPNVVGKEGKEMKKMKVNLAPLVIPPPPVESLAQKVEAIKGKGEAAVEGGEKVGEQIKKIMVKEAKVEEQWETVVKKRRGSGSAIKREGQGKNTNFVEGRKPAPNVVGEEGKDGSSRQKAIEEGRRIFIGKLPSTIKHDDVRDYFQQFGQIAQITIKDPKEPGAHGIAFVNMANRKGAVEALKSNKKPIIGGHQVVLDLARY